MRHPFKHLLRRRVPVVHDPALLRERILLGGYYGESCFACSCEVPSGSGGEAPLGERLCLACFEISERVNFGRQFGYCIGDRVRTITGDEYNHRAGIVQSFDDEPGWIEVELDDMRGLASFLPTELQPENGDSPEGLPCL